jgi:peptidoglycan-associated lipoprotein
MIKETILFFECGKTHNVRAEKKAYTTKEESVTIADRRKKKLDIALEEEM